MYATVDLSLEVALIPLVTGGAKQLDGSRSRAVPHGSSHDESGEEHSCDGAGKNGFDVAHSERFVETLGRTRGDVEDAGNDADDASSNVVGNDSTGIEGVETFGSPRRLNRLEMTC